MDFVILLVSLKTLCRFCLFIYFNLFIKFLIMFQVLVTGVGGLLRSSRAVLTPRITVSVGWFLLMPLLFSFITFLVCSPIETFIWRRIFNNNAWWDFEQNVLWVLCSFLGWLTFPLNMVMYVFQNSPPETNMSTTMNLRFWPAFHPSANSTAESKLSQRPRLLLDLLLMPLSRYVYYNIIKNKLMFQLFHVLYESWSH